jgi:hypothetical protein
MEEHTSKPRVAGEQSWSTLSGPMSREPWQGSFPSCPLGSSWVHRQLPRPDFHRQDARHLFTARFRIAG